MTELETDLLNTARRRSIDAKSEASRRGLEIKDVQRAIAKLRRNGLIYQTGSNSRPFHGACYADYRAA